MNISRLSAERALHSLHSQAEGLSEAEAARRLAEYGPNRVERVAGQPAWRLFLAQFSHFFALILWLAAGLALAIYLRQGDKAMLTLALAITGVVLVNGLFAFWQEYKAEQALEALKELLPLSVKLRRDGRVRLMPAEDLVPGDILHLEAGDAVPADCRVLSAYGLSVNNATLTGESEPQVRDAESHEDDEPLSARNRLLAGTAVATGEARAVVYATGMRTRFGHIAHLTQHAADSESPLTGELRRLSRLVAVLATGLGLSFLGVGAALGLSWEANLLFAIGIIVANVPEGLLPTVTLSLAMATQRMAKRQALVRHLPAVEALGSATVIVSDKTGTLTENRMRVVRVYASGREQGAETAGPPWLREIAGHCHSLVPGAAGWLGDPMEIALAEFAGELAHSGWPRRGELPFDSERRRMAVLHATPAGLRLYVKGAVERVLPLCGVFRPEDGAISPLSEDERTRIAAHAETLAAQGLRVLALASKALVDERLDETGLCFAGLVGLEDPPRPEVPEAIARCREAGIRVLLCTGDHPATASAIARQIGLCQGEPEILLGEELGHLSDTQLQLRLDRPGLLCARAAPEHKRRLVEALQRKGEVVAVTGDGVNDAPALKTADIGIAMGLSGTDVAKAAADIVLLDDNFATIVHAIEEGRAVYANVCKFLTYILSSNVPEILPYLAFVLFGLPLPLTIVQVLAVDLGTDMLPALALGREPPAAGTMREPPRPRGERLLTTGLLLRAYAFLGLFEAGAMRLFRRAGRRRLGVRAGAGRRRSLVPDRHHRLFRGHRPGADRQSLPLPPPRVVPVQPAAAQCLAGLWPVLRNRPGPGHRVHAPGPEPVRHGAARTGPLARRPALDPGHGAGRRAEEVLAAAPPPSHYAAPGASPRGASGENRRLRCVAPAAGFTSVLSALMGVKAKLTKCAQG